MGTTNLNRLKVVLVEQNKTGKWLAEQLGKFTCSVSKWCQNTVQPDLQTLDKISRLLDVNIKDLLVETRYIITRAQTYTTAMVNSVISNPYKAMDIRLIRL